ncbi:MAG: alanine racemase [Clostridia bacterium]|nr:alanine racemase [Clostridia bacterium]
MFSEILINKQNLIDNVLYLKSKCDAELCVMVKANAYGHGAKEVVTILQDYVQCFGVSNQAEALALRSLTNRPIIVFGRCENYFECMARGVNFALLSLDHAKEIVSIYKSAHIKPQMHLCVNSGMNRYGVRDVGECKKIIKLLKRNGLALEGIYTHFSSLTTDEEYTKMQQERFKEICKLIPGEWDCITHVGGGRSVFEGLKADMFRVGLYAYGYGEENLKPVMSVQSKIVDIQKVKKGEHVGYLCGYSAQEDMTIATVPLGYGDGLPRKLSNALEVDINGQRVKNVGNICMDAFMVDVSDVECRIGDCVTVLHDATALSKLLQTTEYEVLTNMTKLRGTKKII